MWQQGETVLIPYSCESRIPRWISNTAFLSETDRIHFSLKYSIFDPVEENCSLWTASQPSGSITMQKCCFPTGAPEKLTLCPNSSFLQWWLCPAAAFSRPCHPVPGDKAGWVIRFPDTACGLPLCLFSLWLSITPCPRGWRGCPLTCPVIPFNIKCISVKINPCKQGVKNTLISQVYKTSAWRMWWRNKLFQLQPSQYCIYHRILKRGWI